MAEFTQFFGPLRILHRGCETSETSQTKKPGALWKSRDAANDIDN